MTAAIVGITKVAIIVESKNLARKDHGVLLSFIPSSMSEGLWVIAAVGVLERAIAILAVLALALDDVDGLGENVFRRRLQMFVQFVCDELLEFIFAQGLFGLL